MKKILYIFILFLIFACANKKPESSMEVVDIKDSEVNKMYFKEKKDAFAYESLAKQKLQDYYDLLLLQKKHPEFKDNITKQLEHLSKDSFYITDSIKNISIENLQQIGDIEIISDSIKKLRLTFDIVSDKLIKKDSTTAIIKSIKMTLNNEEVQSTKISFQKLNK